MKHVPLAYWATFNASFRRTGFTQLGELLDGSPSAVARTWREGGFTTMFDFPLGFAMTDVFCRDAAPEKLAVIFTNDRRLPDPSKLVTLIDNHDLPRVMSACGHDVARVKRALTFLLTARGVPSLMWGTEVGLDGEKEPENRQSMRFVEHPLREEIARLLALRQGSPALERGAPVVLAMDSKHLAVGRAHADQLAVVVVNQGSTPWKPALAGEWSALPAEYAPGVQVAVGAMQQGRYTALAREVERQWRTGATKRAVSIRADAPGLRVVGSGEELGDWTPARGVPLPATLELPEGGVFELKLVDAAGHFASGDNVVLQVPATATTLELHWPDSK